jgi:hypothetical protein
MMVSLLWMSLVRFHRLTPPPDECQVPDLQRALQYRNREEASIVIIV